MEQIKKKNFMGNFNDLGAIFSVGGAIICGGVILGEIFLNSKV